MPPDRRARGSTVRAFRLARELTLEQLAALIEPTKGHLSHIERGRYRASLAHTAQLAAALDVPAEALTGQVPPISALREIAGVPFDVLAADVEIPPTRLARIERGTERAHVDELALIARRLGVDVAALGVDPVEAATA